MKLTFLTACRLRGEPKTSTQEEKKHFHSNAKTDPFMGRRARLLSSKYNEGLEWAHIENHSRHKRRQGTACWLLSDFDWVHFDTWYESITCCIPAYNFRSSTKQQRARSILSHWSRTVIFIYFSISKLYAIPVLWIFNSQSTWLNALCGVLISVCKSFLFFCSRLKGLGN